MYHYKCHIKLIFVFFSMKFLIVGSTDFIFNEKLYFYLYALGKIRFYWQNLC